jgi:hypothetical protein
MQLTMYFYVNREGTVKTTPGDSLFQTALELLVLTPI